MSIGRPHKITPEIREIILESINSALPYEAATWRAGICEKTLYNWLNKAKADKEAGIESEHLSLLQDIKRIEGARMQALAQSVMMGVDRWQSCAWMLERRWRQFYGADAGVIAELQATFAELKAKLELQESK